MEMTTKNRIAAILGFLGVALGAFGAHSLPHVAPLESVPVWDKAVLYHLIHAVAILAVADMLVAWLWLGGVVVFSGSLYLLALTGIKWLGAITPIGGLLFLAGWLLLVIRPGTSR